MMADKLQRKQTPKADRLRFGELMATRGSKSATALAAELGVPETSLYAWQKLWKDSHGKVSHPKVPKSNALVKTEDKDEIIRNQQQYIVELEGKLGYTSDEARTLQKLLMTVGKTL
jgi:hypothetical protein